MTALVAEQRMISKWMCASALVVVAACSGDKGSGGASGAAPAGASTTTSGSDLTGAGATFPYPIYSKWFNDYAAASGVKINYQSIGSGGGIRQLTEQTVDFGASDAPMSDDEAAKLKAPVMHFPTVLGAVCITYNLPGVTTALRLSGPVIAGIYQGTIKKWNAPEITALNAGVTLPDADILVVHRSDGSGTTYIFSDYLAAVSPDWAKAPGKGKELQWPVGIGGKGNEGVAGQVKQTPGAIGYVELAYAKPNNLPVASIKNAAGQFVTPSVASVTAAAEGVAQQLAPNSDYRLSIVNAPGATAYPISSFTYLLVYKTAPDSIKGKKLVGFLRWMYTNGEPQAAALDYAPLPPTLITRLTARLDSIQVGAGHAS
jgi:phosphate transport system substrate-binding protein